MSSIISGKASGKRIGDLLGTVLPLCGQDWAVVIRGIDSTRSPDDLSRILASRGIAYSVTNGNICLSIPALGECLNTGLFVGFDEVWIFDQLPNFNLAFLPSVTSDAADFSSAMPRELANATEDTRLIVVLGDGCGLNYAVRDERILHAILVTP